MSITFKEIPPDDALEELYNTMKSLVVVEVAQYKIESDTPLVDYSFHEESKFREFFDSFSSYASPLWSSRISMPWDFSKVPFRKSSTKLDGVYKILRTGGAHSETTHKDDALTIEETLRVAFQKGAPTLLIFAVAHYKLSSENSDSGFVVSLGNLGEISPFFEQLGWDDLMFVINPKYKTLYVIACTDTD
ncbi:MAG: hypothetical protein ACFFEM_06695 [Candidatus Thorarchaeota archaeon]